MPKERSPMQIDRIKFRLKDLRLFHKKMTDRIDDGEGKLTVAELCKLVMESEAIADKVDEFDAMLETEEKEEIQKKELTDKIDELEFRLSQYEKTYGKLDI